jgi:hypothetical protein
VDSEVLERANQDPGEPLPAEVARQWNSIFSLHRLPGVRVQSGPDPAAAAGAEGGASRGEADELAGQAVPGVLAALGQADPVAGPADYSATLGALQSISSMADLLATLEEIATTTGEFDALHAFARQSASDDARLMTAFQVVATIGRGSRNLGDVMALNAHLQELAPHEPLAVVQYAARKVAGADMETEGHQLVVHKTGYLTETRQLVLSPGQRESVAIELETLEDVRESSRRWAGWKPWAVVGAGVAVGMAGAVAHWRSAANFDAFDARFGELPCGRAADAIGEGCKSGQVPLEAARTLDRARLQQRVAVGAYVAGGAVLATGLALVTLNRPRIKDATLEPLVSPSMMGVEVRLHF